MISARPPLAASSARPDSPVAILGVFDFTPEAAAFDHGSPALREILRLAGLRREALARTGLILKIGADKDPEDAAAQIRRALGLGGPTICLPEADDAEICGLAAACLRAGQASAMLAGGPAAGEDAAGIALFKLFDLSLRDGDRALGLLEPDQARPPRRPPFRLDDLGALRLWPIQAPDRAGMREALENLERELESGADLARAHRARLAAWTPAARLPTAALLGRSRAEIRAEARALRRALAGETPPAFWSGEGGSAYVARPLGPRAPVAFVHAGGLEEETLHGARISAPLPPARRAREESLDGLKISARLARLLTEGLGIAPNFAFGHGLGEVGMLAAAGVWGPQADPGAALRASDLVARGLSGPKLMARRYFGHDEETPESEIWAAARLTVEAGAALEAAARRDDVFMLSLDSPNSVVAAGAPEALARFAADLGAEARPAPDSAARILHCELARMGFSEAAALFRQSSRAPSDGATRLSARDFRPIRDWSPAGLSWALAEILCAPADFRSLTKAAHEAGARIFVECGPGIGAAGWISETLDGLPHAAVALQTPGLAPERAFWSAMARLMAEGIRLDPAALAEGPQTAPRAFGPGLPALAFGPEPRRAPTEARRAAARRTARRIWAPALAEAEAAHAFFERTRQALSLGLGVEKEGPRFGPQAEGWMRKWAAEDLT
ncbi:hypothetical protein [Neomegalonema perideroedes]|uniref:hypothetical protein n=1 Tax=Neomegalonema perideroedes TaxID=217219 RepID=UPI00035DCF7F|nr:hypothetical protein [Neomegalonema perideroedes]